MIGIGRFEDLLDQQRRDLFQHTAASFGQIALTRAPVRSRHQVVIGPIDILEMPLGQHVLDQIGIGLGVKKQQNLRIDLLLQFFIPRHGKDCHR